MLVVDKAEVTTNAGTWRDWQAGGTSVGDRDSLIWVQEVPSKVLRRRISASEHGVAVTFD